MIAPSFWVDPKTGNNYMLSVQYPDNQIQTLTDFEQIPLRAPGAATTTPLESVASSSRSTRRPRWTTTSCGVASMST